MKSHTILSTQLHHLSTVDLRRLLLDWLRSPFQHTIVTPNPEFLLLARHDLDFAKILNHADLSLPDGIGLKFAAWFNGFNLHRHTGVDTIQTLTELCAQTNQKLLLLGGKKDNSEIAAKKLKQNFPNLNVVTFDPGRISDDGKIDDQIIKQIHELSPHVLAVALGQRKQEKFIERYLEQLSTVKIAIGIGGALDMISGNLPRAPKFMRYLGLEWLWRLMIEPKRWLRIFRAVIIFPMVVVFDRLKSLFTKIEK